MQTQPRFSSSRRTRERQEAGGAQQRPDRVELAFTPDEKCRLRWQTMSDGDYPGSRYRGIRAQQAKFTGAVYRLGVAVDAKLPVNLVVVLFDRTQRENQFLGNRSI